MGEATAFALLVEMPELGALEHKCAASLAGLAPVARDSGQHRGKRFIRGGRAPLRQALYMPALVAVRFDAAMKARSTLYWPPGNRPRWRSSRSCESSSSSPTPSCATARPGPQNSLDQHGYSSPQRPSPSLGWSRPHPPARPRPPFGRHGLPRSHNEMDASRLRHRGASVAAYSKPRSADTALRLAHHLGTSAQLWLNLQTRYDLAVAEREHGAPIAAEVAPTASCMPMHQKRNIRIVRTPD